jgi:hypothetical protein
MDCAGAPVVFVHARKTSMATLTINMVFVFRLVNIKASISSNDNGGFGFCHSPLSKQAI